MSTPARAPTVVFLPRKATNASPFSRLISGRKRPKSLFLRTSIHGHYIHDGTTADNAVLVLLTMRQQRPRSRSCSPATATRMMQRGGRGDIATSRSMALQPANRWAFVRFVIQYTARHGGLTLGIYKTETTPSLGFYGSTLIEYKLKKCK